MGRGDPGARRVARCPRRRHPRPLRVVGGGSTAHRRKRARRRSGLREAQRADAPGAPRRVTTAPRGGCRARPRTRRGARRARPALVRDVPKRASLEAVRRGDLANLGQPPARAAPSSGCCSSTGRSSTGTGSARSLARPLRRPVATPDVSALSSATSSGRTLANLAQRPFRTRPTFLPGAWGGQWLRERLGIETDAPNLAWSYELITPESGILLGGDEPVEVGFELLMALHGEDVLGAPVAESFGSSFPIRFDYLDTLGGGHLSLQCHPTPTVHARDVRAAYTQDETYYVMRDDARRQDLPRSARRRRPRCVRARARSSAEAGVDSTRTTCRPATRRAASPVSRSRRGRPTRAAPATSCSRSARRRTCTRCASTTGSGGTSTASCGPFT